MDEDEEDDDYRAGAGSGDGSDSSDAPSDSGSDGGGKARGRKRGRGSKGKGKGKGRGREGAAKAPRAPSAYNLFVKAELARLKQQQPGLRHQEPRAQPRASEMTRDCAKTPGAEYS